MGLTPQSLLADLLDEDRKDGRKRTVLVAGAGMHKQFLSCGEARVETTSARALGDGNALVRQVANARGLRNPQHDDPAASWESLVCNLASAMGWQAHEAEDELLAEARTILAEFQYPQEMSVWAGGVILDRFRDVISLNIDDTLPKFLKSAGAKKLPREKERSLGRHRSLVDLHVAFEQKDTSRCTTVWFPHGHAAGSSKFILGTRNYGMMLHELEMDFRNYKAWCSHDPDRKPGRGGVYSRRAWQRIINDTLGTRHLISWLRLFMVADLVFIGTKLDRAETDLWWALHQRQRNLARVREEDRPRVFIVTSSRDADGAKHLCTRPAGIIPVCYPNWDDAWSAVLGRGA